MLIAFLVRRIEKSQSSGTWENSNDSLDSANTRQTKFIMHPQYDGETNNVIILLNSHHLMLFKWCTKSEEVVFFTLTFPCGEIKYPKSYVPIQSL